MKDETERQPGHAYAWMEPDVVTLAQILEGMSRSKLDPRPLRFEIDAGDLTLPDGSEPDFFQVVPTCLRVIYMGETGSPSWELDGWIVGTWPERVWIRIALRSDRRDDSFEVDGGYVFLIDENEAHGTDPTPGMSEDDVHERMINDPDYAERIARIRGDSET